MKAFVKPIGKFQVLKHRLAEMATQQKCRATLQNGSEDGGG